MALTQTQVSELYVAIFNRASEGDGNSFWQGIDDTAENIANQMLATDDAVTYFGDSLDSNQAFIEHIYLNTLGKTVDDDAEGIAFWVDALEAGNSRGFIVSELVAAAQDEANAGDAQDQFVNRVAVSNYTAETLAEAPEDYATSLAFDGDLEVTNDETTVSTAESFVDSLAVITGDIFTLTTDQDVVLGTTNNDTVIGVVDGSDDTFSLGDVIDGGAGTDLLRLSVDTTGELSLAGKTLSRLEELEVFVANSSFDGVNVNNNDFTTVTLDYAGVDHGDDVYMDDMNADTALVIENVLNDGYSVYRNNDGTFSTLEGEVTQSNTFTDIDSTKNDEYMEFYNYAYFSQATTLNLSTTISNHTNGGTTSTGSDSAFYMEDYVELEADNGTINLEYNITDAEFEDDYTEIYAYVDNGASADVADDVNTTINVEDVDGLYVEVDHNNSGTEGDSDTLTVNLAGLLNSDGSNEIDVAGVETITINVTADSEFEYIDTYSDVDAAQTITLTADADFTVSDTWDVADDQVVTMTATGAGDVAFELNGDNAGFTLDASAATGAYDISVGTDTGSDEEIDVTTGSGDDTVELQDAFDLNATDDAILYNLDAGEGTDTFEISAANAATSETNLAVGSFEVTDAISNFEALSLTSFSTQDIDATTWGLGDIVTIDGYTTGGSLTVNDAASVTITGAGTTDFALVVDGADDAGSDDDSVTVTVDGTNGTAVNDLTINDVETVNVVSNNDDADESENDVNTVDLIADDAVTVNVTGETTASLTFGATTDLTLVETVDASAFDGGLTLDLATAGATEAVTVTTGAGADDIIGSDQDDTISVGNGGNTVEGGAGLDTITLGDGVTEDDEDTIVYSAVTDSQGVTVDVINGFQVATQSTDDIDADDDVDADDIINDVIDLSGVVIGTATYSGEANGYGAVLTSLAGDATNSQAVLDTSTSTLYVDVNADGALDDSDMAIQLTGITDLSADNFAF
jgi:hypothetical protein